MGTTRRNRPSPHRHEVRREVAPSPPPPRRCTTVDTVATEPGRALTMKCTRRGEVVLFGIIIVVVVVFVVDVVLFDEGLEPVVAVARHRRVGATYTAQSLPPTPSPPPSLPLPPSAAAAASAAAAEAGQCSRKRHFASSPRCH